MNLVPHVVATLIGLVAVAAGARWTVRAARRRPQLRSVGVMVLHRPRAAGALLAVLGSFFGLLLALGLAGVLPDADAPTDWGFVGVTGGALLICVGGAAALIGDKIVVRTTDGQISYQPVFGRERQLHVSSVAQVAPVPGSRWMSNDAGVGLFDAQGRPLLKITGVWRGTDHLLQWVTTSRPDVLMS